jgi:hypothetical protein
MSRGAIEESQWLTTQDVAKRLQFGGGDITAAIRHDKRAAKRPGHRDRGRWQGGSGDDRSGFECTSWHRVWGVVIRSDAACHVVRSGHPVARVFGVRWKLACRRTATAPMTAKIGIPVAVLLSSGWLPNMDRTANVDDAPYRRAVRCSCVRRGSARLRHWATTINANGNTCLQWGGDDAVVRRDCLLQCREKPVVWVRRLRNRSAGPIGRRWMCLGMGGAHPALCRRHPGKSAAPSMV